MDFEQTLRKLARQIDDIWPHLTAKEKGKHKETMRRLRMCNPAFREMWYEETTIAARARTRIRRAA